MLSLSKDMETGIEKIDTQHRELIDRINKLLEAGEKSASKEETQKIMDYLGEYIVKHFGDEQEIHIKTNYPKAAEHKEKHALYVENFRNLQKEFAEKGSSMEFMMKLNNSVITWIVKHIKGDDVEFGKFYKAQQA
jgi:hemerythrin